MGADASMAVARETDLYQPVKSFLEGQGYAVKGEVDGCDLVAVRGKEEPVVVELKRSFSLELVFQAVDRLKLSDKVYLAFAKPLTGRKPWHRRYRDIKRLCRMLGVGMLIVDVTDKGSPCVEPHVDPAPYRPRKSRGRRERLLKEFATRVGDPNIGGANGRPVVTAYRQDALRCADALARKGPLVLSELRAQTGVARAASIMQRDVYGWFERVERGVYAISPRGHAELEIFADVVKSLRDAAGGASTADEPADGADRPSAALSA